MGSKKLRNKNKPNPGPHPGGPGRRNGRPSTRSKRFVQAVLKNRIVDGEMKQIEEKVEWNATQVHPLTRRARSHRRERAARQARKANRS